MMAKNCEQIKPFFVHMRRKSYSKKRISRSMNPNCSSVKSTLPRQSRVGLGGAG